MWTTMLVMVVTITLSSWVVYFLVAGADAWILGRLEHGRGRRPAARPSGLTARPVYLSLIALAGTTAFTTPIFFAVYAGHSRVYGEPGEHGILWLLVQPFAVLAFQELCNYWIHRALHASRWLFRTVHARHHEFRAPTPWASMAIHPVDSFLQILPTHVCAFLFPVHILVYVGILLLFMVVAVTSHDGVTWVRSSWIASGGNHAVHHAHCSFNFGQFTTVCDKLFGSYRPPG